MHDADTDDDLLGFLAQKKRDMAKLQEAAWAAQEQAETVAQLRRKMEFLDRLAYGDDPRDGSPERGVEASSLSSVDRVRFGLTANFEDAMLTRRTPLTWQENAEMTWGAFSSAQLAVHSDELAWNCGARGGNVSLGALNIPLAGHTSVRLGSPEKLRDLGPPGSPIGASSCLSPQDRVRFGLDNCPPLAAWARPATPRTPRTPVRSPVPRPRSRDELSPAPVSVSPIFRTRRSQSTPYLDEGGSRAGSPTFLSKSDRARFGLDKPRRDVGVDDLYDEARPRGRQKSWHPTEVLDSPSTPCASSWIACSQALEGVRTAPRRRGRRCGRRTRGRGRPRGAPCSRCPRRRGRRPRGRRQRRRLVCRSRRRWRRRCGSSRQLALPTTPTRYEGASNGCR
eukprot:TRINITY_DN16147_c0_g1_i2.p1 TRINITY_DN16147_c0_g1~~TRINITY_DN16147_c0_g1_i2.p1  ORF type:complete len:395 (+),score=55.52 TRINITY_DN16147_c0_g1_i2:85-1269(+)